MSGSTGFKKKKNTLQSELFLRDEEGEVFFTFRRFLSDFDQTVPPVLSNCCSTTV